MNPDHTSLVELLDRHSADGWRRLPESIYRMAGPAIR